MSATTYTFAGDRVALIVRGKKSPDDDPGLLEQHADCILSNGMPVGFYGAANAGPSGGAPSSSGDASKKSAGSSNSIGLGMTGVVFDFAEMRRRRANYADLSVARATGTISTALIVTVSASEARAFDQAWADMTASPGSFQILGWNCSTHASQVFVRSGILSSGIPGLDTPNNLYLQLCAEKGSKVSAVSGYIGFSAFGTGYMMTVEEP
ncbi:MAG: hypothetical protein ACREBE_20555 [bacterium]